jgi:hypothetical protein
VFFAGLHHKTVMADLQLNPSAETMSANFPSEEGRKMPGPEKAVSGPTARKVLESFSLAR